MSNNLKQSKPWLFMGIGNILFNEDPSYAYIYLMMYDVVQQRDDSVTFDKLLSERDELIKDGQILPLKVLIEQTLTEDENKKLRNDFKSILEDKWLKYNPLNFGVREMLEELQGHYNLGIIANGPAFLRAVMQEVDILKYFKVIVISEEVGIPKPNRGIFEEAFQMAREYCESSHEVYLQTPMIMVGDSLEQDIVPANQNKMTGIHLSWDFDLKYEKSPEFFKDEIFKEYIDHLKAHSSKRRKPVSDLEKPAHVVKSLNELCQLLISDSFKQSLLSASL